LSLLLWGPVSGVPMCRLSFVFRVNKSYIIQEEPKIDSNAGILGPYISHLRCVSVYDGGPEGDRPSPSNDGGSENGVSVLFSNPAMGGKEDNMKSILKRSVIRMIVTERY
jgi:hypothetical protein